MKGLTLRLRSVGEFEVPIAIGIEGVGRVGVIKLQKELQSYRQSYRVTELQRELQSYRESYRVTELQTELQSYRQSYRVTELQIELQKTERC